MRDLSLAHDRDPRARPWPHQRRGARFAVTGCIQNAILAFTTTGIRECRTCGGCGLIQINVDDKICETRGLITGFREEEMRHSFLLGISLLAVSACEPQ